jgi:hypothetical protein
MLPAKKTHEQGWYAKIERAAPKIPGALLRSIWRARSAGIAFFASNCVQFRPPAYCSDPPARALSHVKTKIGLEKKT